MSAVELRVRGLVRWTHLFHGAVEQLAIMIAPDTHIAFAYQRVRGDSGLQRAGEMVPQIDDQIRRMLP